MNDWKYKPPPGSHLDHQAHNAQGIILCMLMNDQGGTIAHDISGNGNNGTLTNMAFPPTATSGWNPGGVAFDGTNDFINCGFNSFVNVPMTVISKFYVYDTNQKALVSKYNYADSKREWSLQYYGSKIDFISSVNGSSGLTNPSAAVYSAGRMYVAAGVLTGATKLLYVEGNLAASIAWSTQNQSDSPILIGCVGNGSTNTFYQRGIIEFVFLYNRVLTPSQIAELTAEPYSIIWKPSYSKLFVPSSGGTIYYANLSDSVSLNDSLVRSASIFNVDSISLSDDLLKAISLLASDSISVSDAIVLDIGKVLSDTVSITDVITQVVLALSLSDSVAISDSMVKTIDLNAVDIVGISESLVKALGISLNDAVTISDNAIVSLFYVLNLTDSISIMDAGLTQQLVITKSDTVGISDSIVKSIGQKLNDTVTLADVLVKLIQLGLADNINIADDVDSTIVTITVAGYTISFTVKKPEISFTAKKPDIDFTAKKPDIDFTGK